MKSTYLSYERALLTDAQKGLTFSLTLYVLSTFLTVHLAPWNSKQLDVINELAAEINISLHRPSTPGFR
jgi:hypothetical protein